MMVVAVSCSVLVTCASLLASYPPRFGGHRRPIIPVKALNRVYLCCSVHAVDSQVHHSVQYLLDLVQELGVPNCTVPLTMLRRA